MHIIGYIISYIFILYMFGIVYINSFLCKLGQILFSLTFQKIYMHYIMKRREYADNFKILECAFDPNRITNYPGKVAVHITHDRAKTITFIRGLRKERNLHQYRQPIFQKVKQIRKNI